MSGDGRIGSALELVPVLEIIPEDAPATVDRPGSGAILVMKDGSFRMVLRTGAVNFDLKGDQEQQAIIFGFGELLSGLDTTFPIQILCHSKRLDPQVYLRQFEARLRDPDTPDIVRRLIRDRIDHFQDQVRTSNMLQREFFMIIPWEGVAEPQIERHGDQIPLFRLVKALSANAESKIERRPEPDQVAVARQQLDLRAYQIESALERLSVRGVRRLGEDEVLILLDEMYNPSQAERRRSAGVSALQEADPTLQALAPGALRRRGGEGVPTQGAIA